MKMARLLPNSRCYRPTTARTQDFSAFPFCNMASLSSLKNGSFSEVPRLGCYGTRVGAFRRTHLTYQITALP
jgi:hypothetical protein